MDTLSTRSDFFRRKVQGLEPADTFGFTEVHQETEAEEQLRLAYEEFLTQWAKTLESSKLVRKLLAETLEKTDEQVKAEQENAPVITSDHSDRCGGCSLCEE